MSTPEQKPKTSLLAIAFLVGCVVYGVIVPAFASIVWPGFREVGLILLAAAVLAAIAFGFPGFTKMVQHHRRINALIILIGFRGTWLILSVLGLFIWAAFRVAQQ